MLTLAEEATRDLPMSPWAFGGVTLAVFLVLLVVVLQFDRSHRR